MVHCVCFRRSLLCMAIYVISVLCLEPLLSKCLFAAQNRIYLGMTTIKDVIIKRPNLKSQFLDILLEFTVHEKAEVRLVWFTGVSICAQCSSRTQSADVSCSEKVDILPFIKATRETRTDDQPEQH